jgi:hypothetical protein
MYPGLTDTDCRVAILRREELLLEIARSRDVNQTDTRRTRPRHGPSARPRGSLFARLLSPPLRSLHIARN